MPRRPPAGSSTLALVMVNDLNDDGKPNWGDTVTFDVKTDATPEPHVILTASQDGRIVYSASAGFYPGYPWPWTVNMTLASTLWTGGAARAHAELQSYEGRKIKVLATLDFDVAA